MQSLTDSDAAVCKILTGDPCPWSPVLLTKANMMKNEPIPPGEDYEIRCPRLGHQIIFSYCRRENMGLPYFKTLDCWFEHFLVETYLPKELNPEEWEKTFNKPRKPKMLFLTELIEEAKKRIKEET